MKTSFSTTCLLVLVFGALVGCVSPRTVEFVDSSATGFVPAIESVWAEGDILFVRLRDNASVPWIAGLQAEVIDGSVYVSTIAISSPVNERTFSLDLSGRKFPRDWKSRVYWVMGDAISSPINPFIRHFREIKRKRLEVDEEKKPNQALQTTPVTRSVYEKIIEFGCPQRGV